MAQEVTLNEDMSADILKNNIYRNNLPVRKASFAIRDVFTCVIYNLRDYVHSLYIMQSVIYYIKRAAREETCQLRRLFMPDAANGDTRSIFF